MIRAKEIVGNEILCRRQFALAFLVGSRFKEFESLPEISMVCTGQLLLIFLDKGSCISGNKINSFSKGEGTRKYIKMEILKSR